MRITEYADPFLSPRLDPVFTDTVIPFVLVIDLEPEQLDLTFIKFTLQEVLPRSTGPMAYCEGPWLYYKVTVGTTISISQFSPTVKRSTHWYGPAFQCRFSIGAISPNSFSHDSNAGYTNLTDSHSTNRKSRPHTLAPASNYHSNSNSSHRAQTRRNLENIPPKPLSF